MNGRKTGRESSFIPLTGSVERYECLKIIVVDRCETRYGSRSLREVISDKVCRTRHARVHSFSNGLTPEIPCTSFCATPYLHNSRTLTWVATIPSRLAPKCAVWIKFVSATDRSSRHTKNNSIAKVAAAKWTAFQDPMVSKIAISQPYSHVRILPTWKLMRLAHLRLAPDGNEGHERIYLLDSTCTALQLCFCISFQVLGNYNQSWTIKHQKSTTAVTMPQFSSKAIHSWNITQRKWRVAERSVISPKIGVQSVGIGCSDRNPLYPRRRDRNASSSPSATSSAVTSGYTGITALTCNDTSSYSSPYAAMFTEECQKSYIAGQPSYTSDSTLLVANLFGLTLYTFEACMDECAKRNLQFTYSETYPLNGTRCEAVSYYADLTASVGAWRGNCFLKNVRGVAANGNGPVNASLTASAYLATT
nr:hypothetical protein CFP56_56508 [Quercus suber]